MVIYSKKILKYLFGLVVVYFIAGFFLLPYIVKTSLPMYLQQNYNISSYIDSVHLNPFNAKLRVDNFIIKDQQEKNLFYFEKLYLDLDLFKLFEKNLYIEDFILENSKIYIAKNSNNVLNYQFIIDNLSKMNSKQNNEKKQSPFSIYIENFKLLYFNLVFTDLSKAQPWSIASKPIDFSLKNFSLEKEYQNDLNLIVQTRNSGEIKITSKFIADPISLHAKIALNNINTNKFYRYFKPVDIPVSLSLKNFDSVFDLSLKADENVVDINLSNIDFKMPSLEIDHDMFTTTLQELDLFTKSVSLQLKKHTVEYQVNNPIIQLKKIDFFDKKYNAQHHFSNFKSDIDKISSNSKEPIGIKQQLIIAKNGILKADLKLFQEPLIINADLTLDKINLKTYNSYIEKFVNLDLKSGFLTTQSRVGLKNSDQDLDINLASDIKLFDIDIMHKLYRKPLLKIDTIDIDNLKYTHNNLLIDQVSIEKPDFLFEVHEDKTNSLTNIVVDADSQKKSNKKQRSEENFDFLIKKLNVDGGKAKIVDKTVKPSFHSQESEVDISIQNITSKKGELTHIEHSSVIDKYATLQSKGSLDINDPFKQMHMKVDVENIDLPSLSTYSGKYIGSKIDNGKLSLNLLHRIDKDIMNAQNKILIKDIELGEKVNSEDAIDAPIGLAIALLEDSSGYIDLDLPIKGNLNNPQFDISDAIFDVIRNTLVGIVSAPFKLLAMLVGAGDKDHLSQSYFAFGSSMISASEKETLDKLVIALKKRPGLQIKLIPSYAFIQDKQSLVDQKFTKEYPSLFDKDVAEKRKLEIASNVFTNLYSKKELDVLKKDKAKLLQKLIKKIQQTIEVSQKELEQLADKRVFNIKEYFVQNGIEQKRIKHKKSYMTSDNLDKRKEKVLLKFEL